MLTSWTSDVATTRPAIAAMINSTSSIWKPRTAQYRDVHIPQAIRLMIRAVAISCPALGSVPFTSVLAVYSLYEAIERSNEVVYGLTAGIYSEVASEVEQFLDEIHTGVLYVNRRAGATTGAWPGVQPFGGWKGSGSTGKAALGPYYPAQFLREQSHTIVD